jgi:hypothetical protein
VIIPSDPIDRSLLYEELVRQCTASRSERFQFYQVLRNYYLFGSRDNSGAPYNKIGSTVDTLNSFIYSPDSLRFSLHLGTEAAAIKEEIAKSVYLAREVTEQWRISRTHILFGTGLRWSCVYGCMLLKTLWDGSRARSYLVEPHQFGVLREDVVPLGDQEAFTHHYTITRTQLEASLEGNPRKAAIMGRVGRSTSEGMPPLAGGLSRLLIGSPVGGIGGSFAIPGMTSGIAGGLSGSGRGPNYDYAPRIEVPLIDMCDLYVWNDEAKDYQVVTRAAPDVVIYDRLSEWMGHVKGLPPFNKITPDFNLYDYFFGFSFVARLTWLQDWRTDRLGQIHSLLNKQVDPPQSITGGVGIAAEKLEALRRAGGQVSFPTPNAKVTDHKPDIPNDVFAEVTQIDAMFDDEAGLGHVLQGKGEAGVRSRGQADLMARLGSARPKERAIAAEESAEDVAGYMLRLVQDHSDQRFQTKLDGGRDLTFIAEQFTRDYEVKVDAHSSSPIFVEDRKHDAITLLEAKAITRATLLDMYDPPNLQELKEDLKAIEQAEAKAHQEEMQMMAAGMKAPGKPGKKAKHE